jgi:hypothetical protein
MRLVAFLLVVASCWGCNAIFGVDGLRYDAGPGGTGTTTSASGGDGGAPTSSTGGGGGVGGIPGAGGMGGGGGRVPPPPCGGPNVLTEDFSTSLDASVWDIESPNKVSVDGGQLVAADPFSAFFSAGIESSHTVRLTDDYVEVEVIDTPQDPNLSAYLTLRSDDGSSMGISQRDDKLRFQLEDGGPTDETVIVFDPQQHRWWRIEERNGTVLYRTSPDGDTWTDQRTLPRPAFADFVTVAIGNHRFVFGGSGEARFDNLNTRLTSAWCAAETPSDDFEDGNIGPLWRPRTPGDCSAAEIGGRALFTIDLDGECRFESSSAYVLEGSHVAVDVEPVAVENTEVFLRATDDSGAFVEVGATSQDLYLSTGMGGTVASATTAYDPSVTAWRVREAAGIVYLEAREGAQQWTELLNAPTPGPLDAVELSVGARSTLPLTQPFEAAFDDVNL